MSFVCLSCAHLRPCTSLFEIMDWFQFHLDTQRNVWYARFLRKSWKLSSGLSREIQISGVCVERRVVLGSFWHAALWTSSQSPATHPRNFGWRIWICVSNRVSVQTVSVLKGMWKELGGDLSGTICSARWGSRQDDSGACSENSRISSITASICPSSRVMSPWLFKECLMFCDRELFCTSQVLCVGNIFLIWQILKQI